MNEQSLPPLDRIQELLADRALFGLDDVEQHELEALLVEWDSLDVESLERTAAATHLGLLGDLEAMPPELAARIAATATQTISDTPTETPNVQLATPAPVAPRRDWLAWCAAAAAVLVALFSLNRGPLTPAALTPAALRTELLAATNGVVEAAWTAGGDAAGEQASGKVLWHNGRQQGVMQFNNLAANDPVKSQYQLWIFDKAQDERYPIDGGVFDIPAGQDEVLIAINAKIPVTEPTMFAITIEKPGGVVVSSRERLPLLAKVE